MGFDLIDYKVREYILNHPSLGQRSSHLRMSMSGDCPRMLDYDGVMGQKPIDYYQSLKMIRGTWLHPMWQSIMKGIFGSDFIDAEEEICLEVEAGGEIHKIPGHPDGVIVPLDAVYELKSVSRNTFDLIQRQDHPLPSHVEQGNAYAHVKKRGFVLIHYYCPDNGESLYYQVPYSESLALSTIVKFRERIINRWLKRVSDRPYHNPTAAPCFFCSWREECYAGFREQVSGFGQAPLPVTSELYEHCKLADRSRFQRLMSEKLEDEARAKSAEFMIANALKSASIGEYEVEVSIGKKGNPIATIRKQKE